MCVSPVGYSTGNPTLTADSRGEIIAPANGGQDFDDIRPIKQDSVWISRSGSLERTTETHIRRSACPSEDPSARRQYRAL